MTPELRPRDEVPTRIPLALAGLGCAVGAGVLALALRPIAVTPEPARITITETLSVTSSPVVMKQEPPPPAPSSEIQLVFTAGGATYMKLATLEVVPRHGKAWLAEDGGDTSAIAVIADADLPSVHRAWIGKRVTVDGTCTAKITGFAVIARLTGYPGYAGIEDSETWSPVSAMDKGAKVLAAKLDNCAGGTFARDVALPAIVLPVEIEDAPLAAAATKALYATPEVQAAQQEWATSEQKGIWYQDAYTQTQAQVLRHPKTGATWVSVHLYYGGGCGMPNLNVWGLYRADADGKLTRMKTSLGELIDIEKLVDLEGDGDLEVIGRPWLGTERAVQHVDGAGIEQLELPFYSCAC